MRLFLRPALAALLLSIVLPACKPAQPAATSIQYQDYRVTKTRAADSAVAQMLRPYSDSINSTMNKVIGFATSNLQKKQPESNLGNLMADAMRVMGTQKLGLPIDAAFINFGGVRSYIPKGEITVGKVYELMPFDNIVVVQQMDGRTFRAFLHQVAARGGWPSSGIEMTIDNKLATAIKVGGQPIDDARMYNVANSDYVANGGDDCDMLRPITQINKGYLLRDAIIQYIVQMTSQGKPIDAPVENRIRYASSKP